MLYSEQSSWMQEAKTMGVMSSSVMLMVTVAGSFISPTVTFISPLLYQVIILLSGIGIWGDLYILRAMQKIAAAVNDEEINHNARAWFALKVLALLILVAMIYIYHPRFVVFLLLISVFETAGSIDLNNISAYLLYHWFDVVVLVGISIALIAAARFLRDSYELIATRTRMKMFKKVGHWYYLSMLLVNLVFIGFVIILIALVLQLIAFSHLPKSIPSQTTVQQSSGA